MSEITLEQIARWVVVGKDIGRDWKHKGWKSSFRYQCKKIGMSAEDRKEVNKHLSFMPDAYSIEKEGEFIWFNFLEIENTNKLSIEKLIKICNLFDALDALTNPMQIRVFRCDYLGSFLEEVPLSWINVILSKQTIRT